MQNIRFRNKGKRERAKLLQPNHSPTRARIQFCTFNKKIQQKETIPITKIKERQRNAERRKILSQRGSMKEEEKKRGDELIRYRLALPDLQRIKWGNTRDGATVRKHRIEKRNLKPMSFHLESVTGCRSIHLAPPPRHLLGKECNPSPRQRSIKCRVEPSKLREPVSNRKENGFISGISTQSESRLETRGKDTDAQIWPARGTRTRRAELDTLPHTILQGDIAHDCLRTESKLRASYQTDVRFSVSRA